MIPRMLQKDVRIRALLKLEKYSVLGILLVIDVAQAYVGCVGLIFYLQRFFLRDKVTRRTRRVPDVPVDQIRKLGKGAIDGTNTGGTDDTNYGKCEKILAKIFTVESTQPVAHATTAKNEEEKLVQKHETIKELPLEAESVVQGLDAPPRVLAQSVLRPYDVQQKRQQFEDVAFDDIARKLMRSPPREIDKRLLEAYLYPRSTYNSIKTGNDELTIDRKGDRDLVAASTRATEVFPSSEEETGVCSATVPPFCRVYSVDFVGEATDRTWKVERPQPTHCNTVYATYIEKGTMRRRALRDLEQIGAGLVTPQELMLVPLPPNETAISSREGRTIRSGDDADGIVPTSISLKTRPSNIGRGWRDDGKDKDQFVAYFSTVSESSSIKRVMPPQLKKDPIEGVPLSVLLKMARQRSRIEGETKKKHTGKSKRYFSKGTCLPPLDFQDRGKTSSPRPCGPVKKSSTPKQMPCPPPKRDPCPPPKKTTCPPPKDPCDPCKPPPKCPPKEKPCGLFTGNRIKDTITLILCACMPLLNHRLQGKGGEQPLWSNSAICGLSTLAVCPTVKNPSLGMQRWGSHLCTESSLPMEMKECKGLALTRGFEPWSPIPSWPTPKKEPEKRLICQKEGCQPPKPSHGPCKFPSCKTGETHRKFLVTDR